MYKIMIPILGTAMLVVLALPAFSQKGKQFDFKNEAAGVPSKAFSAVVGAWHIDTDGPDLVYAVDGRVRMGSAPADPAQVKELFGENYREFLTGVERLKDFPLAILREYPRFKNGTLTVTFKAMGGKEDQAAGIAFNIKPNGEYLAVRANALEDNLVLFKFDKKTLRSSLKWINKVPPPTGGWHSLKVVVKGKIIEGYLDGKKYLEYAHNADIDGRIGLWSKADSYVFFSKFELTQ